jgi:hypothetical protein
MKYLYFLITITALLGCAQPAVNVHLSFFGIDRTLDFGIRTVFEEGGDLDWLRDSSLYEILSENEAVKNVNNRIITSVVLYFAALIFFITAAVYSFYGRLWQFKLVLPAAALSLYFISGRVILTVPEAVSDAVTDILGFFAGLIDIEKILTIELGTGYWVVFGCMTAVLLMAVPIPKKEKTYDL